MGKLPKVELHRHLEGAVRPATILDLFRKNCGMFIDESVESILPKVQITGADRSLADFLAKFEFFMPCLRSSEDITRITREAIEDCAAEGIVYVELRFSPVFIKGLTGLSYVEAVESVLQGAQAVDSGPIVNFIVIIPQPAGEKAGWDSVRLARDYMSDGITGVDIADDTRVLGLEEYVRPLAWARANGLGVTVHAGESEGPESVRVAVERLGATRIGHGVRALEDQSVVTLLSEKGVLLEVCPTSNVHTGVVAYIDEHPLPELVRRGVAVCINTDDPGISGITLGGEYEIAHRIMGLSESEIVRTNLEAIEAAFAEEQQRARVRSILEAL
jgi:adenosine deaminase